MNTKKLNGVITRQAINDIKAGQSLEIYRSFRNHKDLRLRFCVGIENGLFCFWYMIDTNVRFPVQRWKFVKRENLFSDNISILENYDKVAAIIKEKILETYD